MLNFGGVTPEKTCKRQTSSHHPFSCHTWGWRTVEDGIGEAAARQGRNAKNVIFLVNTLPETNMHPRSLT